MEEWIPMYNNDRYEVNVYDGSIRNKKGKVLKGKQMYQGDRLVRVSYNIKTDDGVKTKKGHRIVAEAVLKKDLSGIPIGHRNNINGDNSFKNLIIGSRATNSRKIQVLEWKNGVPTKKYDSLTEFERETGINRHTKGREIVIGCYRWEKLL